VPAVDLVDGSAGADPALDVALPHALLGRVAARHRGPVLRSYRPRPTVAFGRRDSFLAGFPDAVAAAKRHAFTPVVRGAGGRAAAYDEGCLVFDLVMPAADSMNGIQARFSVEAELQARALRGLGVDARVGEVPGEYCPGEFSVNARGRTKLIGAAQRIVSGAWLLSSVVVVEPAAELRAVLEDVYAALGLEWDPATTGSVADEAAGVSIDDVRHAILEQYRQHTTLIPGSLSAPELAAANDLIARYRV
jgi:octanoyl-[GcvH]:protein N-octanoyltransferase